MTFSEIETAIGQHLSGMANVPPIAWPNRKFTPGTVPYLEFRHAPNGSFDPVIAGGYAYQIGLVLITVVIPANQFTTAANTLAQAIANRFPKALRLMASSGNVVINAPTSLATPFQDGAYWRQPVRISYITEPESAAFAGQSQVDVSSSYDGLAMVDGMLRVEIEDLPQAGE